MDTCLSALRHRNLLDVSTATTIGRVEGLVLDFEAQRVLAVCVGQVTDGRTILDWDDVRSIGPDAVTIDAQQALRTPEADHEARVADGTYAPLGKPVITEMGDNAGRVDDVVIDSDTGALRGFLISGQPVDAGWILAVGDHAAVTRVR